MLSLEPRRASSKHSLCLLAPISPTRSYAKPDRDFKGLDEYTLHELLKAVVNGADRPPATDILDQLLTVFNFTFDMRKKISMNMESLQALVIRMSSYGVDIGTAQSPLSSLPTLNWQQRRIMDTTSARHCIRYVPSTHTATRTMIRPSRTCSDSLTVQIQFGCSRRLHHLHQQKQYGACLNQ
jgi:hypothetical protein